MKLCSSASNECALRTPMTQKSPGRPATRSSCKSCSSDSLRFTHFARLIPSNLDSSSSIGEEIQKSTARRNEFRQPECLSCSPAELQSQSGQTRYLKI